LSLTFSSVALPVWLACKIKVLVCIAQVKSFSGIRQGPSEHVVAIPVKRHRGEPGHTYRYCPGSPRCLFTGTVPQRMMAAATISLLSMRGARPALVRSSLLRAVHTEAKIAELGLTLPPMPKALGVYVPAVRSGNYIFTAGHIYFTDPTDATTLKKGKVGVDYTTAEAADIAKGIALELIATLKNEVGDLDKIKRIVKVVGFVNAPDTFEEQPEVLNGCSKLLGDVFGERGVHARSAVGTNSLPRNVPVEIELIAEVED